MTDPGPTGDRAAAMRADTAAASRLFLASNRNIPIRLITGGCITVAALPFLPWWVAAGWWCCLGMIAAIEGRIAAAIRGGAQLPVWEGMLVPSVISSVITGGFYTALMAALWMTGDPIARAFAIAQTCISVLYVLLQYYARPKTFLVTDSPYLVGASLALGDMGSHALKAGRPLTVLTAVLAVGLLGNLFVMARRQLAASRDALRTARAEAQERGVAAEAANEAKSSFLATMSH